MSSGGALSYRALSARLLLGYLYNVLKYLRQIYLAIEEVVSANDLQLVLAGEGLGKHQRGRSRRDHSRIDHHVVTVHDVQRAAVTWGVEVQVMVIERECRNCNGRFGMPWRIQCRVDD